MGATTFAFNPITGQLDEVTIPGYIPEVYTEPVSPRKQSSWVLADRVGSTSTGGGSPYGLLLALTQPGVVSNDYTYDLQYETLEGTVVSWGGQVYNVKSYGAKGDVVTVFDGAIASGSSTLTSATANFTSSVTGKPIVVQFAGVTVVASTPAPLIAVATYVNSTTVTLSVAASNTVTASQVDFGTDDTTAVQNALNAVTDQGGIVYFPRGTYFVNNITGGNTVKTRISVTGDGVDTSILKACASVDHVIQFRAPGFIRDITVDGCAVATNGLSFYTVSGITIPDFTISNVKARNVRLDYGDGWVLVVWDALSSYSATTPYYITNLYVNNVTVENSAHGQDAISITCVDNVFVSSFTMRNMHRSPNFFVIKRLYIDGMYVSNIPDTASFVIDSDVDHAFLNNVFVDKLSTQVWLRPSYISITNSEFYCSALNLGVNNSGNATVFRMSNSFTSSLNIQGINGNPGLMVLDNVNFAVAPGTQPDPQTQAGINDGHQTGSTIGNWLITNCTFDNTNASNWLFSGNSNVTWQNIKITNCKIIAGSTAIAGGVVIGSDFEIKNVSGFNPDVFYSLGSHSTGVTVDRKNGNVQSFTMTGSPNLTVTNGLQVGDTLTILAIQDGSGGHTVVWPGNVVLAGGSSANLSGVASATDIIQLVWDGTNWNGNVVATPANFVKKSGDTMTGALITTKLRITDTNTLDISDNSTYRSIQSFNNVPLSLNPAGNSVAVGQTSGTAALDIVGSSTSASGFRLRSGTAPTSPNDGDIWYDGTNIKIRVSGTTKTFTIT